MPIIYLFGVVPMCLHMLYLMYVVIFVISAVYLLCFYKSSPTMEKHRLLKLIAEKQSDRAEQFKKLRDTLKSKSGLQEYDRITSLSFDQLVTELERGNLTAVAVLDAYTWKALTVTEKLNCITELDEKAWDLAAQLDEQFRSTACPVGPLHGVPFCVKEDFDLQGMDTTLGYARNLSKPAQSSALLVQALVKLGAVPFCKTNLPQTTLSNGSHNPIFGETKNCIRPELSPAGSSSGTGSLVGAGGALFGLGSDLGGSVRTPAHNCGISAIRPTTGRLSAKGIKTALPTMGVPVVPGILAQDSKTLAHVFELLVQDQLQHRFDSTCPPVSWNDKWIRSTEKLRIGYFTSLSHYPAMGDTPAAVRNAVKTLESLGHTAVEFQIPDSIEMSHLFLNICLADGGEMLLKSLENEPVSPDVTETWPSLFAPSLSTRLLTCILDAFSHRKSTERSAAKLWRAWHRRSELRSQVLNKMDSEGLAAIMCPVFAFPAVRPEDNRRLMCASYTMIWSLLDLPVVVARCGVETGTRLNNTKSSDAMVRLGQEAIKNSVGMPIGVQIAARPFQEEICLRLACQLELQCA